METERVSQPLFPPYLNQGAKGPAVNVLGILLKVLGYEHPKRAKIVLDGDYTPGGAIAAAVKQFQRRCGISADGNFGPETRKCFREQHGFDVNTLTEEMFKGETICPPES